MLEVLEEEAAEAKVAKARVIELEGELAAVKGRLEEAVEATGGGPNPAGTTSSGLEERCEALEEKCEDLREELDAMKMLYTRHRTRQLGFRFFCWQSGVVILAQVNPPHPPSPPSPTLTTLTWRLHPPSGGIGRA